MQKKLFSELGLSADLQKAITRVGYEEASPIQSEAIPVLLSGRDVVGQSQTGSGKTAAFALPAIEKVDASLRAPQVLILCPTRELAVQVAEEVAKLAFFKKGVRELPIYGGQSYDRQYKGLQAGSQIIIGTPGRVMDHLSRGSLKLDHLKMLILDEADRMLDMGFREDIETILKQAPVERQTVFFSATLPQPIKMLIKNYSRDPVNVRIESATMDAPLIEQVYYEVDRRSKLEVLGRLIDMHDFKYGLIFCATKMMCDELTEHLIARGYAADKLHGDMTQQMRERVMGKFRKKGIEFLVATDVAARGLDVDDIEVVFNYDLPHDGEDYVHRIGRTGRAGKVGRAITFVAGREIWKMQNIIKFTRGRIKREKVPSAEEVEEKRTNVFFDSLKETLEKGDFKRHDALIDRLLEAGHVPTDIASALIHLLGDEAKSAAPIPEDQPSHARREYGSNRDYPKYEPRSGPRERSPGRQRNDDRKERPPFREARPDVRPQSRPEPFERPNRPERAESPVSHEVGMTRLNFNLGRDHQIAPGDLVGVIAGVARLPKENIGAIRVQTKTSYVDVADDAAALVLKKLNGIKFKGRKLAVSRAA
jgi:ATP-dependent RNA helicase DeaD